MKEGMGEYKYHVKARHIIPRKWLNDFERDGYRMSHRPSDHDAHAGFIIMDHCVIASWKNHT